MNKEFEESEVNRKEKVQGIPELKSNINGWNARLDNLDRALEQQEQYSKRNCLLIHIIDKENQEIAKVVIMNIFKKEVDEEITHQDIK